MTSKPPIDENEFELNLDDRGLICLLRTMEITEELMEQSPVLSAIKRKQYSQSDFVSKAIAAFLTACIHQKRLIFCFSSDTLGELLSQDANNPKRNTTEVKEREYKRFIKELFDPKRGWFRCLLKSQKNKNGKIGHPYIAELRFRPVVEEIERLTGIDADRLADHQYEEAKRFAQYNTALKNASAGIAKLAKRYIEERATRDKSQTDGQLRIFQKNLGIRISEFLDLTDSNLEYIEKLKGQLDFEDKIVRANIDGIIERLTNADK